MAHAAPFAYITQSFTNTVAVVDTATNTVVATIEVDFTPFGVAVHPSGSHVYVGDEQKVSVIETATNTVVATVPAGMRPSGLAIHPDGSRLYVADQVEASVTVIDTATIGTAFDPVVGTVTVDEGPMGLAVNPAGTRLYVANNGLMTNGHTVTVVDTATLAVVATVAVGQRPVGIAVAPSGARVYVTNVMMPSGVSVIDAATNTVVATVPIGVSPRGIAVHPSGAHAYVATGSGTVAVIETASNTVVASPSVAPNLYGIGVTPSGSHVYVASQGNDDGTGGAVVALATATNTVSGQVPVGDGPTAFGLFITPEAASCDTTALEQAMAAARQQVTALQTAQQTLGTENGWLQAELNTARASLASFVDRLFGERTDGHVAAAARAAALGKLTAARATAPRDWRLRLAQQAFDEGERAMRRRDWGRAVHEFRKVHVMAERIAGAGSLAPPLPVPTPAGSTAPVVTPLTSGCDATLEQALAAVLQQVAALQAANQARTAENERLRAELDVLRTTLESFVDRLFGERTDGHVAAAAQAAALAKLAAAKSAKPADWRLKFAQYAFDNGTKAMRHQHWRHAVHEFREAFELAERVLSDRKQHPGKHGKKDDHKPEHGKDHDKPKHAHTHGHHRGR